MNAKAMNTRMSSSEMIVAGLAVAVLVAGFATGVFAKPIHMSPHGPFIAAHVASIQAQSND